MNSSFINKYGYSTLLLQSSIIVLLALFFLLAPSTVLAEEITDKENTENSESLDDNGNSEITKDDDTTIEDPAETDETTEDESITNGQPDNDEAEDSENVDRDEIDNIDEEVENDGDENVDEVDEETENVDDTDEIDEEEIDREHDEDIIEEEGSEETDSDEPESEDEAQEDEDLIDEADEEAAEEDEAEDETEKDESSKENSASKQSPSKSTMSTRSSGEIGKGVRDKRVVQLKKDLARLGFNVPGNGTDLFGTQTEKQVKALQKYYGLKETGTLNKATADKINAQISSPFQNGKRHNDTLQIKRNLNKIGFGGISVTTLYGDFTVQRVKEFQKYFGLKVTGIADDITRARIDATANSPYQEGKRHNNTLQLKRDLNKIGFGGISVSTLYGDFTAQRVKEFQKYFGLKVSGIADDVTREKINTTANSPLQKGKRHNETLQLKKDLNKIGFGGISVTTLYGDFTVQRVKEFQKYFELKVSGIADDVTREKINTTANSPLQKGKRHNETLQLKKDLNKIGFGGISVTTLYGDFTVQRVKEFQQYYGLKVNGIVDDKTNNKIKSVANSSFQNGKRHNDTLQLKKSLNKIGFGNITVTTLFSDFTEKRVKQFQQYFGLKVNGIVDDKTNNKIKSVANSSFQNGKRHSDTLQLKRNLNKLGFGNITVTTLFGDFTEKKVREFQEYFSLKVNGIADEITQNKIKSVINSPLQNGKRHNDTLQLKRNLNKIGFGGITVTTLFSDFTEKRVKEFQRHYGLKVSGIADEVTLAKIIDIAAKPSKVIYLDAGHGGSDPGAIGNGLHEKDVTLDIALRTKKELEAAGYTVIMSRTTDKYLSLSERTNHANRVNADIFVSIHINAGGGTGIETYKMANGPKPSQSNKLATHIQNETIKQTGMRDRGVKDANFHVNRESKMPSALVEVGFIDRVSDANKLKQASFKNKAAKGIANGIKRYFA